jgi:formamidopyrimidine-DNA glycosylase
MSGVLQVVTRGVPLQAHTHLVLEYGRGRQLRFVDPRRFGGLSAAPMKVLLARPPLSELGPEPLSETFDGTRLHAALCRSKRVLRDALLDQRVVAGVGNIYAVEALYEAGLHPLLMARRLRPSAWHRLADGLRRTLAAAIERGGTTLRDYRDGTGKEGTNQHHLWVYGRAGQPCRRCGTTLLAFVHGGRSGVFCPEEQAKPRGRWVG